MAKNKKNNKRKHLESKRRKFESKDKRRLDSNSNSKINNHLNCDSNPFEFHRNKVKHNIIGRHLAKNEFGNKGISRNRAYTKRKDTILQEYRNKHKSGKGLQDLRHTDDTQTHNSSQRLNKSLNLSLTEDLVLTHKGKQLNDFIDDTVGSDEEDIDLFNRPEFVESTHFGGGADGRPKSANEVLDQIMDEKREKQMERAANKELTEKLDTDWNGIKNILRHKGVKHELPNNSSEDFDVLVKELMFDRSKPIISVQTVGQTSDKPVVKQNEELVNKSVDTLFREMIESIETEKNWTKILESIKRSTNDLLPKISVESLNLLVDKYQTMSETSSGLNANNLAYLVFGTHFTQTKLIVRIILTQMLAKSKLNSFNEIAIVLLIIKLLVMTSRGKYIPEVFNAVNHLIGLSQHKDSIQPMVGHKHKSELKCILALNAESVDKTSPVFKIQYIFDETLNNFNTFSESQIKSMLFIETLKIVDDLCETYSTIASFNELMAPLKSICSQLPIECLAEDIKDLLNKVLTKLNKEEPKEAMNESRPKPFMLPMFEPKFDDNPNNNNKNSKKKLVKKYNRELKGAQRELRKDSTFMRNTWIDEIQANDQQRKRRVKQLFGDLAQQQGLYKKKKK